MRNKGLFSRSSSSIGRRGSDSRRGRNGRQVPQAAPAVAVEAPGLPYAPIAPGISSPRTRAASALPGRFYAVAKRILDLVISLLALALFGMLLPLIALLIKLDSPGSIFFAQERVGLNRRRGQRRRTRRGTDRRKVLQPGRPFRIYKLRTMCMDAEADGPRWAAASDPRVTRVGHILRQTRLDEVPQFINVLKGEMSVIGPRPERLHFVRQFEKEVPHYRERLQILPGITGLAQIRNGYDQNTETVRRKVELDREYINRSGLWTDLKILLSTIKVVLTGEGAC